MEDAATTKAEMLADIRNKSAEEKKATLTSGEKLNLIFTLTLPLTLIGRLRSVLKRDDCLRI